MRLNCYTLSARNMYRKKNGTNKGLKYIYHVIKITFQLAIILQDTPRRKYTPKCNAVKKNETKFFEKKMKNHVHKKATEMLPK